MRTCMRPPPLRDGFLSEMRRYAAKVRQNGAAIAVHAPCGDGFALPGATFFTGGAARPYGTGALRRASRVQCARSARAITPWIIEQARVGVSIGSAAPSGRAHAVVQNVAAVNMRSHRIIPSGAMHAPAGCDALAHVGGVPDDDVSPSLPIPSAAVTGSWHRRRDRSFMGVQRRAIRAAQGAFRSNPQRIIVFRRRTPACHLNDSTRRTPGGETPSPCERIVVRRSMTMRLRLRWDAIFISGAGATIRSWRLRIRRCRRSAQPPRPCGRISGPTSIVRIAESEPGARPSRRRPGRFIGVSIAPKAGIIQEASIGSPVRRWRVRRPPSGPKRSQGGRQLMQVGR